MVTLVFYLIRLRKKNSVFWAYEESCLRIPKEFGVNNNLLHYCKIYIVNNSRNNIGNVVVNAKVEHMYSPQSQKGSYVEDSRIVIDSIEAASEFILTVYPKYKFDTSEIKVYHDNKLMHRFAKPMFRMIFQNNVSFVSFLVLVFLAISLMFVVYDGCKQRRADREMYDNVSYILSKNSPYKLNPFTPKRISQDDFSRRRLRQYIDDNISGWKGALLEVNGCSDIDKMLSLDEVIVFDDGRLNEYLD